MHPITTPVPPLCTEELKDEGADAFPLPDISADGSPPTTPLPKEPVTRDQAALDTARMMADSQASKCAPPPPLPPAASATAA